MNVCIRKFKISEDELNKLIYHSVNKLLEPYEQKNIHLKYYDIKRLETIEYNRINKLYKEYRYNLLIELYKLGFPPEINKIILDFNE